jgi:hypothetical protein
MEGGISGLLTEFGSMALTGGGLTAGGLAAGGAAGVAGYVISDLGDKGIEWGLDKVGASDEVKTDIGTIGGDALGGAVAGGIAGGPVGAAVGAGVGALVGGASLLFHKFF